MDPAEEARASIEENFSDQLAACRQLQRFADSQLEPPWPGRAPAAWHELLIAAEVARASKTFRAVVTLCEAGFGEQAAMLNRGLFEGMAVAHWIRAHPEDAVEGYAKQSRHTRLLWAETLKRLGWDDEVSELPKPEDGELAELAKRFGHHGTRLWTGHKNLPDLIRAIEGQWDVQGRLDLWTFHDVAHRDNNLVLHSGASALERAAAGRTEDNIVFDIGPSNRHIAQALLGAFWPYSQILGLFMDTFEMPTRSALTDLGNELLPTFRRNAQATIEESETT